MQKRGFQAVRTLPLLLTLCALAALHGGCEKIVEEFSGLEGFMAPGDLSGTSIEIYDASLYLESDPARALIATTTVGQHGRFTKALPDSAIGRPLLLIARFPADDPLTTADERALYRSSTGSGDFRMNPEDGPWYAMVPAFLGLSARVTVSPLTTAAFHAHRSLPDGEYGANNLRYFGGAMQTTNNTLAANFELSGPLATTWPRSLRTDNAGVHGTGFLGERPLAEARLRLALTMLDRAALDFASQTTDAADDQRAFLRGFTDDAIDGVFDGLVHGQPVPAFAAAGAPDLSTQPAPGVSALWSWMIDSTRLSDGELNSLAASTGLPRSVLLDSMLSAAQRATGACRPMRIDGVDTTVMPDNGDLEVTVRGAGFVSYATAVISNEPLVLNTASGSLRIVTRDTTGTAGTVLATSAESVRFRIPEFSKLGGFQVPSGHKLRRVNLFLRSDFDGTRNNISTGIFSVDALVAPLVIARHFDLILVHAEQVDVSGAALSGTTHAVNAGVDPDPNALRWRFRVLNAGTETVEQLGLNLTDTTLARDVPGATPLRLLNADAGASELRLENAAALSARRVTLLPGEEAWLEYPVALAAEALGTTLNAADVLAMRPTLSGFVGDPGTTRSTKSLFDAMIQQDRDDDLPDGVRLLTVVRDTLLTPLVTLASMTQPNLAEPELLVTLRVEGNGGLQHRTLSITSLELTIDSGIGGESPQTLTLASLHQSQAASTNALSLGSITGSGVVGTDLPLGIDGNDASLRLRFASTNGGLHTGTVTLTLTWRDQASGITQAVQVQSSLQAGQ